MPMTFQYGVKPFLIGDGSTTSFSFSLDKDPYLIVYSTSVFGLGTSLNPRFWMQRDALSAQSLSGECTATLISKNVVELNFTTALGSGVADGPIIAVTFPEA